MFPEINMKPKTRRSTSLYGHNLNSPTTINFTNSTRTNIYSPYSNRIKITYYNNNNISKRSKILNHSTNNNTTNYSNFYENLYYYPPHKKKFSYLSNISSEVVLLYEDFNFNKAPSLVQNFSGIRKIIKTKRNKNIDYLNNLFSISICGTKLSKNDSDDNKNNELINHALAKKQKRNNSCGQFIENDKEKMKNLKSHDIVNNTNTLTKNFSSYKTINTNSLETQKETNKNNDNLDSINNNPSTSYIEIHKLPAIKKKENKYLMTTRPTKTFHKQHSIIANLNTNKMKFSLNDCIFESNEGINKVNEFSKKILHMKIFQGFQKTQLNYFLDKKVYSLNKYIDNITSNLDKYKKICKIYDYSFFLYMNFLKKKIVELDKETKLITEEEIKLEYEVDDYINANVRAQKELEKLIDMRNFIYLVRHKDEQIPDIYSTFYFESKRYILATLLIKLFGKFGNISVEKYLMSFAEEIPAENKEIESDKLIVKNSPPLVQNSNNSRISSKSTHKNRKKKNQIEEEKIRNKNIFTSYEEFIKSIKNLEEHNIILLRINKTKNDLIEKYKEILEQNISQEDIDFDERIKENIKLNEKELAKLKEKNLILTKEFDSYNNMLSKTELFKIKKKNKKADVQMSSFLDLKFFQKMNYNNLIKKAKYPGLILFRKILKYYLSLSKLDILKDIHYKIYPEYLEEIINFSINAENNPKYFNFINKYILEMIKLYDYICDYICEKHQKYKLEKKNILIIKKEFDLILDKRKLDNARTIRKIKEYKRAKADKQLIQKWQRPIKFFNRKNYIGTYCRDLIRSKSLEEMQKKQKKIKIKVNNKSDIEGLLLYED